MCGRYFVDDEMWREIKKICKQIDDSKLKVTRGDVRPTDMAGGAGGKEGGAHGTDAVGIYPAVSGGVTYQCKSRDSSF